MTSEDSHNPSSYTEDVDTEVGDSIHSQTTTSVCCAANPHRNKWNLTALIFALGAAVAAGFVTIGVNSARNTSIYNMEQRTAEIAYAFESAWSDYELFALWIHESCTKFFEPRTPFVLGGDPGESMGYCSRQEFRQMYEYMLSEELDIQAMQYLPNTTHEQRFYLEAEAEEYYATNYPLVNYTGFKQFKSPPPGLEPSGNRSIYFPVHLVEPVATNEGVIDLDLYSSVTVHKRAIHEAVETWKPVISDRLKLVQDRERAPNAYSMLLFHPGTPISEVVLAQSYALSLLVIRVPDLMLRSTRKLANVDATVYLHDLSTVSEGGHRDESVFMGANILTKAGVNDNITMVDLPETPWSGIPEDSRTTHTFEKVVKVANREWLITVQAPLEELDLTLVLIGGAVIVLACAMIAWWFHYYLKTALTMSKTQNILASMFPQDIQDRLMDNQTKTGVGKERWDENDESGDMEYRRLIPGGRGSLSMLATKPIADYYQATSIIFADIVGFTAWSSTREPSAVFQLLVETVGDCYVAVAGLPQPRKDHAVAMCRFAADCLALFERLTHDLEVILGPDTADLGLRVGIHSGPITSGVLRGEKPRYQLFGDTINTTSRIESAGERGRIHVSQDTADLIRLAGKEAWLTKREDHVKAKGKGSLQTYWVCIGGGQSGSSNQDESVVSSADEVPSKDFVSSMMVRDNSQKNRHKDKLDRLVDWNTEQLANILEEIVFRRQQQAVSEDKSEPLKTDQLTSKSGTTGGSPFDEVQEVITLPKFPTVDPTRSHVTKKPLSNVVVQQIRDYVQCIAELYRDNPFHNFEHASHVVMSVTKLLGRIIAPSLKESSDGKDVAAQLHDHTYGITSDPLTQFACAYSALIHDADHPGVPNSQLCIEDVALATHYNNRSVAEQNSLDLCWRLLMDTPFSEFLGALCPTDDELKRFRQLVVNSVMATDIMDKTLKELRNSRWERAFASDEVLSSDEESVNRKATIVIEHIIQASDVSHTMQHWHIYRKWNERLFQEMLLAYKQGRATGNPADFWYKGELGFLDFYIIPLAKKLEECGVFGKSSHEYLTYAKQNRKIWEEQGEAAVIDMIKNAEQMLG